MWRFTQSLVSVAPSVTRRHCSALFLSQIGKGMYQTRKLEFIHMRAQVTKLWAQGSTVRSGVVVDSTRVSDSHSVSRL